MQHYSSFVKDNTVNLEPKLVIGLMTGTSMDGIDAALVRISARPSESLCEPCKPSFKVENLANFLYPFPDDFKSKLNQLIEQPDVKLHDVCKYNFLIGELLSEAAKEVAQSYGIHISQVDLIGSHGQTVYHLPVNKKEYGMPVKSTFQIGDSSIIAYRTGVTTISDFRPADIAAGGEGAPLVCYADIVLFQDDEKTRLIQNIGGMGNVTVLPHNKPPFAFDTGPGNILIDLIARQYFDVDYDENGYLASSGQIDEDWVDNVINQQPYFLQKPPKTTGRETFNSEYIEHVLTMFPIDEPENIIANFSALTAKTIAKAYKDFVLNKVTPSEIIVGGGGAANPFLLMNLHRYLDYKIPIKHHEDYGISNKFKEAIAFAILAYTSFYQIPNNVPACTGASKNVVLGKVTYAQPVREGL